MKTCTKCKREQAESEFCKDKRSKDGLRSWCKSCKRETLNAWRDKNREHVRDLDRKYYAADPEKQRAEARASYYKDPERAKGRNKRWFAEHPKYKRDRYKANPEPILKHDKRWRENNPDKHKAKLVRWRKENPSKNHEYQIKRRQYETNGKFTARDWRALLDRYGHQCLACHAIDKKLVADHVIPLSRGGTNTIDNIQPLCELCNMKKHTMRTDYRPNLGTKE